MMVLASAPPPAATFVGSVRVPQEHDDRADRQASAVGVHRVDPNVPVAETFGALGELVAEGKVRYLGISEASAENIRAAHAAAPLSAVQSEYSLFTRTVETNGVLDTVRDLGIGFVAYAPLGRGFLTGELRSLDVLPEGDWRRTAPRFDNENHRARARHRRPHHGARPEPAEPSADRLMGTRRRARR